MPINPNVSTSFINRWKRNNADGYQFGDFFRSVFNIGTNQSASSDPATQEWKKIQDEYWAAQKEAALQQQDAAQASADRAMQFSHDEAELERKWEEYMSNTAVDRQMAAYKRNGLNPILMMTKGFSGASTPSGSAATGVSASMSAANVDTDALVSLLRESMSNQSAQSIAVMNNATKILTSILGSKTTITHKK